MKHRTTANSGLFIFFFLGHPSHFLGLLYRCSPQRKAERAFRPSQRPKPRLNSNTENTALTMKQHFWVNGVLSINRDCRTPKLTSLGAVGVSPQRPSRSRSLALRQNETGAVSEPLSGEDGLPPSTNP